MKIGPNGVRHPGCRPASSGRRSPRAALLAALGLLAATGFLEAQTAADAAVQVSTTVQKTPPQITLQWPANPSASSFAVSRKLLGAGSWGSPIASLTGSATGYVDNAVSVGTIYEYWVSETGTYPADGYVASGIEAPLVDSRGKVVLVVDATYASDLAAEVSRLQQDLVGDGWTVLRHDVSPAASVPSIKAMIQADYSADPSNVQSVFLFGHVPVPYSGALNPDLHDDHYGAWPADVFYGDMDGVWTDVVDYNSTVLGRQHNVAGDGKYDQSTLPSPVELEIGRVDLSSLPSFAPKTERDLLRQYLNKDHNFRHKLITAQPRGLIDDNFGYFSGAAYASNGWRNFAALFGAPNVQELDWLTTLSTQSYLWAYGCGPGFFQGASGVAQTSDFASTDTKVVFTMLYGSYFGDWDTTDNFLRAPLATATYGLTAAWPGRPGWQVHQMGMGKTIGYSAKATQNNYPPSLLYRNSPPDRPSYGGVHVALMGDPTLRMHVVAPPSGLTASAVSGQVALSWTGSPDSVLGYAVYRASDPAGPYARLNAALVTSPSFTDSSPLTVPATYMVRAVKLEGGSGGTYFNASQGIFVSFAAADLSVSLGATPNPVCAGRNLTYTIAVTNAGPTQATSVSVSDALPPGTALVSAGGAGWSCNTTTPIVCTRPTLDANTAATMTIVVTAPPAAGSLTNSATVSSATPDPVTANNGGSVTTSVSACGGRNFYTLAPCRVIDTRLPDGRWGGPALAAGAERLFTMAGQCAIPATARDVSVNLTLTDPSAAGFLTVFTADRKLPNASNLNYSAGQTRGNNAILTLSSSGEIRVYCSQSQGSAHLVLDVNGYFE